MDKLWGQGLDWMNSKVPRISEILGLEYLVISLIKTITQLYCVDRVREQSSISLSFPWS